MPRKATRYREIASEPVAIIAGIDTAINGGATGVTSASYTNSFGQDLAAGGVTTLYTLDPVSNMLFIQNPPNAGTQTMGVPLIVPPTPPFDFDAVTAFDIPAAVKATTSGSPAPGYGYAILTTSIGTRFYRIDLATGAVFAGLAIGGTPATVFSGLAVGDGPLAPTTTTVSSHNNPAVLSTSVILSADVLPFNPSGTVVFTANGAPISRCNGVPVVLGRATCTTSFLVTGDVNIVAAYSGDQTNAPSTSPTLVQHVTGGSTATTTTLSVGPNPSTTGDPVILIGTVTPTTGLTGTNGSMSFFIDGVSVGAAPSLINGTGSLTISTPIPPGTHAVTARFGGTTTLGVSTSASVSLTVNPISGTFTQYFAEGATGNFFHTDLGVFNASTTSAAHVRVTAFPETSVPIPVEFDLGPLARKTLDLNASLGGQVGVSTLVESNQPVAATRQMTWGTPAYGSTLESGAAAPAMTWYFAEGATNVFSLFYLIENPNSGPATVRLTHLSEGGTAPVTQDVTVPGNSRQTYYINAVPGLETAALSTTVTSDIPIVAERAMYLNTSDRLWEGGHAGHGATALSPTWTVAEGATGFFHTYLLFGNPNPGTASVGVTYQFADGTTLSKTYNVPGQSRRTIDVNFEDPKLASTTVGMAVASDLPIVAERAMYWGTPFTDGSASLGSRETGLAWAIGEGIEGGPNDEATFVLVANASTGNATVARFTVSYDDGTQDTIDYTVPANARLTVRVNADFPKAEGQRFSVLVESVSMEPITVDLARYTRNLDAGGAALATRIR